ncbi:hypothetical protein Trydic_g18957 [Trypoxylus dichotomus]
MGSKIQPPPPPPTVYIANVSRSVAIRTQEERRNNGFDQQQHNYARSKVSVCSLLRSCAFEKIYYLVELNGCRGMFRGTYLPHKSFFTSLLICITIRRQPVKR